MPLTPTPDVESDLLAKLAELLPDDIVPGTNAWAGPLRATTEVGAEVFVQGFGGFNATQHNDGRIRHFEVQVTVRSVENEYASGHALAGRIHDALDLLGEWTGESGARYLDVQAQIAAPNYLGPDEQDQEMFAEAFTVIHESLFV